MDHCPRRRWPATLFAGLAALAIAPVGAAGAAPSTPSSGARVAAAAIPPPLPAFGPGTWRGRAIGTGAISASGNEGFAAEPFVIDFEFSVRADGTVESGVWSWSGEVAVATTTGASGVFAMQGSGPMSGTGERVEMTGTIHVSGSMNVQGNVIDVETDQPANAAFSPTWAACTVVTGDLATEGVAAQAEAGVATNVKAPFTARMIAAADADSTLEQVFFELVTEAEAILAAAAAPPAATVVDLVGRIEAWHHQLFRARQCGGAAANLTPGTQPHTYLVELISTILITELADPSAYSAAELQHLAVAAVRIGAVGTAAPDADLAAQVKGALHDALQQKLIDAIAEQDEVDCGAVLISSLALGFQDLVTEASVCGA